MITRRASLFGLLAAPAIIRPGLLMPVRSPWAAKTPGEILSDVVEAGRR